MLAELEEDNKRKQAEATFTEFELTEDALEASQSLQDALSELTAHSQSVKSVRLNNWLTNASTEVKNQLTQKQTLQSTRKDVDLKTDCNQVQILHQLECL